MSLPRLNNKTLLFSAVLLVFPPLSAEAQDVDVPGNLTMHDSTDSTVGNVLKEGVPFLHNFGTSNTFLGSGAGNFTMSGSNNTATGVRALQSNTFGVLNTANGAGALYSNTAGDNNTATGANALYSNTTGFNNTASGLFALYSNTTGGDNTASGRSALAYNTTGSFNTASGLSALAYNTTGNSKTASGGSALFSNTTGGGNTGTGAFALSSNTTGAENTACGEAALYYNTTGGGNTAIGLQALFSNTTGDNNTAIGVSADIPFGSNLSNSTAIGAFAVVDASNKIRLGNNEVTVIEGQVPYTYTSDRNAKENFRAVDADEALIKLRGLAVTSWNYKGQDAKQFRHYGPVAQDFFAAFGHDAVGTIGTPTTITSGDLDGILMVAAQALERRTVELKKQIDALRVENANLKERLEALERRVGTEVRARF